MEPHILIKLASRSRPGRFFEALHNIGALAADKINYTVYCVVDGDDMTMQMDGQWTSAVEDEWRRVDEVGINVLVNSGRSTSKIDAINRPIHHSIEWDILVNFSDDMRFTVYGWDQLIREAFRCNGEDLFLHYPDSTARNMLATMSVMDRKYFERDGYIYHPSYQSLFCDQEAMDVAQMRGRYRYMGTQIFDHYHPAYGHVPWDAQYELQQAFWSEDEKNYNYRKSNNFFLDENLKYTDTDRYGKEGTVRQAAAFPDQHSGSGGTE
jgi:hypothetical protein